MAVAIGGAVLLGVLKFAVYWVSAWHFGGLPRAICRWDCGWYLSIASHGYQSAPFDRIVPGQANWAFFPLYPLLVRAVAAVIAAPQAAGVAASGFCALGLAAACTWYARRTRPDSPVWLWPLLLAAWPFGFYWQAIYTESLYGLLAVFALSALRREQLLAAAVLTGLLSATRPTGILLSVWVAGCSVARGLRRFRTTPRPDMLRLAADVLLPASVAPLGLAAYGAFLGWKLGDPLAFSHVVQVAWHRSLGNPLVNLAASLHVSQWATPAFWSQPPGTVLDGAAALAGLGAGSMLAWRRRYAESFFLTATVVLALCAGVVSMLRYVGANPVFALALGDLLLMLHGRRLTGAVLVAMAAVQLVLLIVWFHGSFVLA